MIRLMFAVINVVSTDLTLPGLPTSGQVTSTSSIYFLCVVATYCIASAEENIDDGILSQYLSFKCM
jgi:hypothetical protein